MKVLIKKASSWGYREVKEINTLEELLKISRNCFAELAPDPFPP